MNKLTKKQLDMLEDILVQYCEDCDSSEKTGQQVDALWAAILKLNATKVKS